MQGRMAHVLRWSGEENGKLVFNRNRVWDGEEVLEMDGGKGHTTKYNPLNYTLKCD